MEIKMRPNEVLLPAAEGAAVAGALKLSELIQSSGKFIYSYDYKTNERKHEYNLLRHYGSLWSILTTMNKFDLEAFGTHFDKVLKALQWAQNKYVKKQHDLPPNDLANIWEFVVWHDHIKLGANALALLAISQMLRQLIEWRYRLDVAIKLGDQTELVQHAEQLARGIHKLRQEDGTFVHKVKFSNMQPTDFVSEYYVGEVIFAMGHWRTTCELLNSHTPIKAIDFDSYKAFPLIMQSLQQLAINNYGVEFQSHWMLHAISQEICKNSFSGTFTSYMDAIVDNILDQPHYRLRKQSTPISCRTEGLLAAMRAYEYLEINGERQERMQHHIDVNIMQILNWVKPDGAIIHGNKSKEVRIDFIQHGITALANYARFGN